MLRATLSLRCFAALRTAYAPFACLTRSTQTKSPYPRFNLVHA
ncbi:MAG: hypothetical protein NZ455_09895 [Bacteroidia bacterium]|nr:hypothetical protein [Bacteroidia bacterium]MDW8346653.1 hypothetical protein [Bacteroidia bacterium]